MEKFLKLLEVFPALIDGKRLILYPFLNFAGWTIEYDGGAYHTEINALDSEEIVIEKITGMLSRICKDMEDYLDNAPDNYVCKFMPRHPFETLNQEEQMKMMIKTIKKELSYTNKNINYEN